MDLKKKVIILWIAFVVCIVATVALWFGMRNAKPEFEEVEAVVLGTKTEQVINKNTGNRTNFYKVEVEYDGKEYNLENVHSLVGYTEGRKVKAYLYDDKLYANEEGVQTSTPIATIYFIFLFGTFGLLMIAASKTSKLHQKSLAED